ncbi:MAG: hypothetical protein SOW32_07100 [Agathobacter sp.]|nr:hypothetical protein [Agathobacter sp.]
MVLASADTKIEDSNENTDKKDTDENGKSNPSDATDNKNGDNSGNKVKMPETLIRPETITVKATT